MAAAKSQPKNDLDESLSSVKDQFSDEEKKGDLGKVGSYIARTKNADFLIMDILDSLKVLNQMKELDNQIKTSNSKEDIINEIRHFHAKVWPMDNFDLAHIKLTELGDTTCDVGMSEIEGVKLQILNVLKDQQRQASKNMIIKMAKANVVAAAQQWVKIYMAWKAISAASNVMEDKNKFTHINKQLQRLETMVKELVEICETQPEDKSIDRLMTKINTLLTGTIGKINDITLNINGNIERLDVTSDYAAVDVVSNTVSAFGHGIHLWSMFDDFSSPAKWLGWLSVSMYAMFGVANAAVFVISQEKLKQLRKELRDTIHLRETLDDLRQQAEDDVLDL